MILNGLFHFLTIHPYGTDVGANNRRRVKYFKRDVICIKLTMGELETKNILTLAI